MPLNNLVLLRALREKFPGFDFVENTVTRTGPQFENYPLRQDGSVPSLQELHEKPREDFIFGSDLVRYREEVERQRQLRQLEKKAKKTPKNRVKVDSDRRSSCGWRIY